MKYKDQFFIIKDRLFETKNIVLLIIMTIIFIIIYSCLTIIDVSIENKKEILNSEDSRTYIVYPKENQIELIKNLEHIEIMTSNKYKHSRSFETSSFDNNSEKGFIRIKALLKENDIKIKKGTKISSKYELVCSNTFYPYEYDKKIYKDLFLSSKEILKKTLEIVSQNEDLNNKKINLTTVGTYENKYMEEINTCYTSVETFDEISSKYSSFSESYDEYGNLIYSTPNEYEDYILIVDSKENINNVTNYLTQNKITFDKYLILNPETLDMLYAIPLFIGIIIIIITLSILNSFISKKLNNKIHNIGILKSIGYEDKAITYLNINENIIIILISSLISLIIYYLTLSNLKYSLLSEITYNNYIFKIPFISIAILILVFILIVIMIVKSKLNKILKLSIQELLER